MTLPACASIKEELTTINGSFNNLMEKFKIKGSKLSYQETYPSDFSICGEKGELRNSEGKTHFIFNFSDKKYKGKESQFKELFEKIFKQLDGLLKKTHYYKLTTGDDTNTYNFYEAGTTNLTSGNSIQLSFSYGDSDDDEEPNLSISISFDHKN